MKKRSRAGAEPIRRRRRTAPKPKRRNAPNAVTRSNSPPTQEETEVGRLTRELTEAREQHAATADVLKVISRSAFNLQIVLDTLVQSAAGLCEADTASLVRPQGSVFQQLASYGYSQELNKFMETHPVYLGRGTITGRTVLEGKAIQIPDVLADAEFTFTESVKIGGMRTMLGVPLLRDGVPIGVIMLSRRTVRPFSDKQVELVKTFADQAVIAIENNRLLNDLRQSLEQQTATSEVLQVISSSPSDLEPVFATMLEKAVRICDANFGNIYRWDGEALHLVATHNVPAAFVEARQRSSFYPSPESPTGRMIANKTLVHTADLRAERAYADRNPWIVAGVELGGARTVLMVPMLKENELIGAFSVYRQEVRPFSDKQIELVKNFAAQAVIAIENARLLNELRERTDDLSQRTTDLTEALEQQTATSEVLTVISSSPGDLQPVFDTMLANATRLCEATHGHVWTFDGEQMHAVAVRGDAPFVKWLQDHNPVRPIPGSAAERIVLGERFVHLADRRDEPAYRDNQTFRGLVDTSRIRASLSVALRKGETLLGMINVYRQEVRPFTDTQIELVENFAAQAVIAIENARLLNELRERTVDLTEALEQQTATSEVLQVVSSSPGNLEPVFAIMLEKAVRICDAEFGHIFRRDGDALHLVAAHNTPPAFAELRKRSPLRATNNLVGRMMATKTLLHVTDLAADPSYAEERDPTSVDAVEVGAIRTLLLVPLLKEGELVGSFTVYRQEVRPFTDKQIALVQNFASQAVIAIDNARLLNELRQSLEQQTATADVLKVISSSPGALEPVFKALLENATQLCGASYGNLYLCEGDAFRSVALHGVASCLYRALGNWSFVSTRSWRYARARRKNKTAVPNR